jgi:tetratricopeptide (TPR) repeat protein
MEKHDEKIESVLDEPWLTKSANRLPFSVFFVLVALFLIKPLIVNRLVSRADAYASYGLYNNAQRECKKAILLNNNNDRAWNTLAMSYEHQGDYDSAIATYLNAININSSNKAAHFWVAMVFAKQGNYSRAIPYFEFIKSRGPETIEELQIDSFSYYRSSLVMLAACYERTNKPDKKQAILESLSKTYPDYPMVTDKPLTLKE